jgi:hypothetical protein
LRDLEAVGREAVGIETERGDPDPTYRVRPQILVLEARGLLAEQDKDLPELLGEFLLRRGRVDQARGEFTKALARTPGRRSAERGFEAASSGG